MVLVRLKQCFLATSHLPFPSVHRLQFGSLQLVHDFPNRSAPLPLQLSASLQVSQPDIAMGTFHTSLRGALAVGSAVAVASLQAPKMSKARGFESHSGHLV
jgi:hypothetical protein